MLTTSELKQVKHYLAVTGMKDTQFTDAETPLSGFEQVAIVQNGINKIVPLSELQETIGIELKKDVLTYSDYLALPQHLANTLYVCTTEDGTTVMQMFLQEMPLLPASGSTFGLSVSPSVIFVGSDTAITITGTANPDADNIKISKGSAVIAQGSGASVTGNDTLSATTTYTAQASILGYSYSDSKTVTAVEPIYYGSGDSNTNFWTNKVQYPNPTTTPARTYTVTVRTNGDYVYFWVPSNMTIHSASMSGFGFPLEDPVSYQGGKLYRSSNTYTANDLTIVIL